MKKTCMWCGNNFYEGFECRLCGGENPGLIDDDFQTEEDDYEVELLEALTATWLANREDLVEEPDHYSRWPIEPINFIMRNGFEFWRGNIIKYASRAGYKIYDGKSQEESEITDLQKVIRYAEMRINQINGEPKL